MPGTPGVMPVTPVSSSGPPPLERDNSSGGTNRKEWAVAEDELILECVRHLGCKWRQIASMLPGRSDDAVRNRWNRLKDPANSGVAMRDPNATGTTTAYRCSKCGQLKKNHRCTWVAPPEPPPLPTPLPTPGGAEGSADADGTDDRRKPERVGWKPEEDEMIKMSVAELGHKWFQIAERLPGRTDHAIRNRWHRLLTMRQEELSRAEAGRRGAAPGSAPPPAGDGDGDGAGA